MRTRNTITENHSLGIICKRFAPSWMPQSPLKYFSSTFLINWIFLPLLLSIKQSDNLHNSAILEGVQNIGDKLKQGPAFLVIGDAYHNLGDFRQALHNHELYLSYIEEEEGLAHGILGKDHLGLGNHKHALICYEQQLEIAKETGERVEERQPCENLGHLYFKIANFKLAAMWYKCAVYIAEEIVTRQKSQKRNVILATAITITVGLKIPSNIIEKTWSWPKS